jgi:hypothetical protein
VIDKASLGFWSDFAKLPRGVQDTAREKHRLWAESPFHPSLHFKEIMPGLWSVRVNSQYRALARRRGDFVLWIWIGTHGEYDRLIKG